MNKKVQILAIVSSTIICVFIMLCSDKIYMYKNLIVDTIEESSNNKKVSKEDEKKPAENQDISELLKSKDNIESVVISDSYKKIKMDSLARQIEEDKIDFFGQDKADYGKEDKKDVVNKSDNIGKNNKADISKGYNKNDEIKKEDIPVFNTVSSKDKVNLSSSDKTKILLTASKLSVVDYEKVKEYVSSGSNKDIKSALKLLNQRLSDKDYEKVKDVANKFLGEDIVEQ